MTIVCYDGKQMVADTVMSTSDMLFPGVTKKIYEPGPDEYWEVNGVKVVAMGFSGNFAGVAYVIELLNKGVTYRTILEPNVDVHVEVILVLETGEAYVLSISPSENRHMPGKHDLMVFPIDLPVAVGSGTAFAFAAMEKAKPGMALKGVKAAIKLCPFCGGEPVTWDLPTPPAEPSKRPVGIPEEEMTDNRVIDGMTLGQLKKLVKEMSSTALNEIGPLVDKAQDLLKEPPAITKTVDGVKVTTFWGVDIITTVAWDTKSLAADTQISAGGMIEQYASEKIFLAPPEPEWKIHGQKVVAFGFAGDATAPDVIKEKLVANLNLETKAMEKIIGIQALIVTDKGDCYYWLTGHDSEGNPVNNLYPQGGFYAIGSGTRFAMGAMAAGGTATEAVKAAARLDVNTGGQLNEWHLLSPATLTTIEPAEYL